MNMSTEQAIRTAERGAKDEAQRRLAIVTLEAHLVTVRQMILGLQYGAA